MSEFFINTSDCRYSFVDGTKTIVSLLYTDNHITRTTLTATTTEESIREVYANEEFYIDMLLSKIKEDLVKKDDAYNFFISTSDCRYSFIDGTKTMISMMYTDNHITETTLITATTEESIREVYANEEFYIDMLLSKIKEDLMKKDEF